MEGALGAAAAAAAVGAATAKTLAQGPRTFWLIFAPVLVTGPGTNLVTKIPGLQAVYPFYAPVRRAASTAWAARISFLTADMLIGPFGSWVAICFATLCSTCTASCMCPA